MYNNSRKVVEGFAMLLKLRSGIVRLVGTL